MTPEEKDKLDGILDRMEDLANKIDSLSSSSSISRDVENAFRERLSFQTVVSSTASTGSASTQNINLTGNAETITVPAQPTGTVALTINGVTYNVLYK